METIQITTTGPPFDTARIARMAVQVLAKAAAMGLLEGMVIQKLDRATFREVMARFAGAGIGTEARSALATPGRPDSDEMDALLVRLDRALEDSPSPVHEWPSLERLFGTERLGELVGVSAQSIRRYRGGERVTPDRVAARLHLVALVVGELAGAYNDFGIRRWFQRPRTALGERAPEQLLRGDWSPDDPEPRRVLELARSLGGSPAT